MMEPTLFWAFIASSFVLIVIPGPNITFIVATSLANGWKSGSMAVAGTSAAMALQLAVTLLGLASFAVFLSAWFEWLRWVGVVYLIYLGVQHLRRSSASDNGPARAMELSASYWRGFLVSITNPKTLLFFGAFLPQFISTDASVANQLFLMSSIFLAMAILVDGAYVILAFRLRTFLRGRWRDRLTGSLLISAGLGLALARRS